MNRLFKIKSLVTVRSLRNPLQAQGCGFSLSGDITSSVIVALPKLGRQS